MTPFDTTAIQSAAQLTVHLKSLRKLRGLTQAQLGERIGVKQVRVADIERNPGAISVEQLIRILQALDVKLMLHRPDAAASLGPARVREITPTPW